MLTTCGDDMAYTDRRWKRLIAARGWQAAGAFAVAMPNTYVLMKGFDVDSPETAAAKLAAMPAAMERIADAIGSGDPDILIRGSWPWVKSYVIYPWFVRHAMSPRPFHHTGACTGCGGCARSCPLGNIAMQPGGTPHWGNRCAMCLRCYHSCPRNAVAYGKATAGKGRYMAPKDI